MLYVSFFSFPSPSHLIISLIVSTPHFSFFFFFNDTATTDIYTLSLHDALPISLIRLFLLVLILLLMPTLNFLPVWFALSLLRFRLPSRLPMMFILWMVAMMVVIIPSRTV